MRWQPGTASAKSPNDMTNVTDANRNGKLISDRGRGMTWTA